MRQTSKTGNTCHSQRRARQLCRQLPKHSARCITTSKTKKTHATALSTTCRPGRRIDLRSQAPRHVENHEILPKATLDNTEHGSIVKPNIARPPVVAPTGTATLSKNWTNPKLLLRRLHSFCTTQPEHLSLHSNRRVDNHPKNCNCEISTVCCTVCTVRTKICMQLESPPLCRGTELKAPRNRRAAGTAAA